MRWTYTTVLFLLIATTVACGQPRKKRGDKDDPITVNNGENNGGDNNATCGFATCDDGSACTIDDGEQDPDTCVAECTYEREIDCVDDDGCCPVGCGQLNDSDCDGTNQEECRTSCVPPQAACISVVTTTDSDGCVVACDYGPTSACLNGDSCCPSGCDSSNDSDCSDANNGANNGQNNGANNGQNNGCQARSCAELGVACGTHDDRCGGTVSCGSCSTGMCIGGQCQMNTTGCDPNIADSCPAAAPYCIEGTCSECVGAADCASDELCDDGFCRESPKCSNDPTICAEGWVCEDDVCRPPTGQGCDPNNPASCPQGTFCDTTTATCVAAGGDAGCGYCSADCTCPYGACNGFLCECSIEVPECPEGQTCLALLGLTLCLPGDFGF